MHKRCNATKGKNFKWYKAKGIAVCPEWSEFENFFRDMGERPDGMSLDRRENSKGYTPDNCRWATAVQQSNNRCVVTEYAYAGESKSLPEWARDARCVVNMRCLRKRILLGWDLERALTTASRRDSNDGSE